MRRDRVTITSAIRTFPDHVPTELIWDHDIDEFVAGTADPYEAVAQLHEGPDIVWAAGGYRGVGGWLLTRYEDFEAISVDHERFGVNDHFRFVFSDVVGVSWSFLPLGVDPPAHRFYRQILQPHFQPSVVKRMEDGIRRTCRRLIAELRGSKRFDYIRDFARYFPTTIFLNLMDLPEDNLEMFVEWETTMVRGETNAIRSGAMRSIINYLQERIDERRANPGEDLISRILASDVDGKPMSNDEAIGICSLLYAAGLDTVLGSLGWHMYRLACEPELQQFIRDNPSKTMAAVDELCRAYGVVRNRRRVMQALDYKGIRMKKGDWVNLPTMVVSRDNRKYPNPHAIDLDRNERNMTFGSGIHYCLGIHLARMEMKIVLEEVLAAFPDIRLDPAKPFEYHTVGAWSVASLPIMWG